MPLHIIDYRRPETLPEVAGFLGLEPQLLETVLSAAENPDHPPHLYVRHRIPKKRGGPGKFRTVWDVADPQVRDAHRAFAWRFEGFARGVVPSFPHPSSFGYIRGRGIKDNAAMHLGKPRLMRCDLKDFFLTINTSRLVSRFVEIGINPSTADILARFVTIEGKLALGLNASPMLANLVCSDLDTKLEQLGMEHGCTYTRYADDIAISGTTLPAVGLIAQTVEGEGFQLSATKVRVTKLGQAHFVTGLSVSDIQAPHVPRLFKKRLRQELYYCHKFGIHDHLRKRNSDKSYEKGINRIDGAVRFLWSIEPVIGKSMRVRWSEMQARDSARVSYKPVHDRPGVEATFLVDETEFEKDGRRYMALACVTTEKIDLIRAHATACLRQYMVDPFAPGRKDALERRGLHFTDAPEDLRTEYMGLLPLLQFRAYIAFCEIPRGESYRPHYSMLLRELLPRRFKSYDRGGVTIIVEENPMVPAAEVGDVVSSIYGDLEEKNERRPVTTPILEVRGKLQEPAFSLPDCLLWVFRRTFSASQHRDLDYLRFERLRDKYRHIINTGTREVFSRRHPIEVRPA